MTSQVEERQDFLPTDILDKAVRHMRDQGWLPPVNMTWVDTPPKAKGHTSLEARAIVRQLQEHPGRWALLGTYSRSQETNTWKRRGCEATSRKNNATGGWDIYLRWPEGGGP